MRSRPGRSDTEKTGQVTWLVPGRLGGMPRPGRGEVGIDADLKAVRDLAVSMVVTLTEEWSPPDGLMERFGLKSIRLPIPDWQPPTLQQAATVCEQVAAELADGGSVVFHCQAGRGRTGTMLAAMLIWDRPDAKSAIDQVKWTNQDWIETASQMRFLEDFAVFRRSHRGGRGSCITDWPCDVSGPEQGDTDVAR